jgi:hypothetical protein
VEDGWIAMLNFREHVIEEFKRAQIDYYLNFGGDFDHMTWRKLAPRQLIALVESTMQKRLE